MPKIRGFYTALGLEAERAGFYAGPGGHEAYVDDAAAFLDAWLK